MPLTPRMRTRAAASSIASGTPSRWRHTSATASALPSPRRKPGSAAVARASNRAMAPKVRKSAAAASIGTSAAARESAAREARVALGGSSPGARVGPIRPATPSHSAATAWGRCSALSSTSSSDREPSASASSPVGSAARATRSPGCGRRPRARGPNRRPVPGRRTTPHRTNARVAHGRPRGPGSSCRCRPCPPASPGDERRAAPTPWRDRRPGRRASARRSAGCPRPRPARTPRRLRFGSPATGG